MVYFPTKNPNLGKFWRVLQKKMLVYFIDIGYILQPLGILYGQLVYIEVTFSRFGMLFQEKSGNPGLSYDFGIYVQPHRQRCGT
jgi:hypothetical protein